MPRIVGVEVPKNKKVGFALRSIYGVGPFLAKQILKKANIDPEMRAKDLNDNDVRTITNVIEELGIKVEGDARRIVSQDIKRLISINSYRGIRHRRGLPVRGQKTHANARTRKGPRRR